MAGARELYISFDDPNFDAIRRKVMAEAAQKILQEIIDRAKRQGWSVVETRDESDEEFVRFVAVLRKDGQRIKVLVDEEDLFVPWVTSG